MAKRPTTEAEWEAKRAKDRERYHADPSKQYKASKKWATKNRARINARRNERRALKRLLNPPRPRQTKEEQLEVARRWKKNNPEKHRALNRKSYRKNRDAVRAREFDRFEKNPQLRKMAAEKTRLWKIENPARVAEMNKRRDALKKSLMHEDSNIEQIVALYESAAVLSKSSGVKHAVDHIIPLKHGGWHHQDNLQCITSKMNLAKGGNPFWISPNVGIKDWRDVPRHLWPVDLATKYLALIEQHKGESIRWDVAA